jgi:hypothetical protein
MRRLLDRRGLFGREEDEAYRADVDRRFKEAVAIAERTPPPDLATLHEDVYATPPWHLLEQRRELLAGPRAGAPRSRGTRRDRGRMPQMNMVQALNDALRVALGRDDRVVLLGEDVGRIGGVFRVTAGLMDEFGEDRVVDMPLNEGGIVGAAIGMALYGLSPIAEIQFGDYLWPRTIRS